MSDRSQTDEQLKSQSRDIKRSAEAIEQSSAAVADNLDRRTVLAADRTLLAAERTYAAWVRTGLAGLAGGIGATAVSRDVLPRVVGKLSGTVLVIFAAFCFVAAVWREMSGTARLKHPDIRPMPKALLVPISLFLLLVSVTALIGIWLA